MNSVSLLGYQVRNLDPVGRGHRGNAPRRGERGVVVGFMPQHGAGHDWLVQWESGFLHFCRRDQLDVGTRPRKPVNYDMELVKRTLEQRAIIFRLALVDGSFYEPKS